MLKKFLGRMAGRDAPPFKAGGGSDAVLMQEHPRAALARAREHFSHGRIADAEAICDAVLARDASDFEAVSLKAGVHWARAELVPATRLARKAAALDPGSATAQANLGALLMDTGDFPAARLALEASLGLESGNIHALEMLSAIQRYVGDEDASIATLDGLIAGAPERADYRFWRSLARLQQGRYPEAWREFEARWQDELRSAWPAHAQPRWDGAALGSRTLLLWAEQGLGDTLQFIRYARVVRGRNPAAHIVAAVQRELVELVRSMPEIDEVTLQGEGLAPFDLHCPLMNLPDCCATTMAAVPADLPYLAASPERRARWAARMAGEPDGIRIGLVWAGASRPEQRGADLIDRRRSVALAQLRALFEISGAQFYSLQIGAPAAQIASAGLGGTLIDWTADIGDFADSAALVEQLDLIITVDTSMVHLAGALGKPVWMLSRLDACWRWLKGRDDSPWYPTLRMFRQLEPMDWTPAIARLTQALVEHVRTRARAP